MSEKPSFLIIEAKLICQWRIDFRDKRSLWCCANRNHRYRWAVWICLKQIRERHKKCEVGRHAHLDIIPQPSLLRSEKSPLAPSIIHATRERRALRPIPLAPISWQSIPRTYRRGPRKKAVSTSSPEPVECLVEPGQNTARTIRSVQSKWKYDDA